MNFDETFPLIYCLNLAKRQDRRVRCEEVFETHGIRAWRFPAVDARRVKRLHGFESAGRYAHSVSTRLIIRRAMQVKAPAVFIFEDDVVLAKDWRERLAEIELPEDWGMFYLGCQHQMRPEIVAPGLVRVRGALDTHAWGIRASHYRAALWALAGRAESGFQEPGDHGMAQGQVCAKPKLPPADVLLARQQERESSFAAYAAFPNLAWQAEEHTDLVGGVYSNYDPDGRQRPARTAIAGLLAETLGGRGWAPAVEAAKRFIPFYSHAARWPLQEVGGSAGKLAQSVAKPVELQTVVSPKVALLFLTRGEVGNPGLWMEYVAAGPTQVYSIYGHAANLIEVQTSWLREAQILERIEPTAWGDISLVRSMLALIHAALTDVTNTHFVFLSESCVPIRPLADLRRVLALDGRSRFDWQTHEEVLATNPDKARRIEALHGVPSGMGRYHSQWLLFNREAAELVTEDDFTEHFAAAWAPDEFYFATVLEMKGWPLSEKVAPHDVTWTDWHHGGPHPRTHTTVTPALAAKLAASGKFFARKFAPGSGIGNYGLHRGSPVEA